ncbi:MAG: 50S ribosome-binding GTPase [Planctomycetes bacterium]|nr:50S ribosome-binding GTPase [Planctomycetota bacterium]
MSRWRIVVVLALVAVPFLVLAGVGSYWLWVSGLGLLVWWPMMALVALGYCLGAYWQRKQMLLRPVDMTPPAHSTERDKQAWQLIAARAKAASRLDSDKLSNPQHYLDVAQEMGRELAVHYYPNTEDLIGSLTVPEILAVVELAAHDLAEMVDRYLPGGHLLTIRDWQRAKTAADWYQRASNVLWAISAVLSPISTATRYAASRVGLSTPLKMLQQNLILWFYTAFLQRLGTYLIELYSGRLRVGARRWRELVLGEKHPKPALEADGEEPPEAARVVTLTLMGQVKAGKSSLINALLGERKAQTDVLPMTSLVERYHLSPPGIASEMVLLDTVGYGHSGPKQDQVEATREAAKQSDLLLLVLHARNPARQADLEMLRNLRTWFEGKPELKMPGVIAVMTHIDLLSPAMEWAPPYDWQHPKRPKEKSIHDALAAVEEQLGEYVAAVVPVCAAPGKVFGLEQALLPALTVRLDEAHAVSLLRCLHAEGDTRKVLKVFDQFLAVGKTIVRAVWQDLQGKTRQ